MIKKEFIEKKDGNDWVEIDVTKAVLSDYKNDGISTYASFRIQQGDETAGKNNNWYYASSEHPAKCEAELILKVAR